MEERAYAKVNFFLRVLRRREDGFHEIETLVVPISIYDSLEFSVAGEFSFSCSDPTLPTDVENLVVRAARMFFAETKIPPNVSIKLQKTIPHSAGLGGGSSDAAATLRGLNKFFGANLSTDQLGKLATQLGSDVPAFVSSGASICRGRGEIVEPFQLSAPVRLVLLKPNFAVPTPWSYSRWRDAKETPGASYQAREFLGTPFVNDLEQPVFEKFPFLALTKDWLRRQPEVAVALMAGSGSTMFAVLHDEAPGEKLTERARGELDPELFGALCETR